MELQLRNPQVTTKTERRSVIEYGGVFAHFESEMLQKRFPLLDKILDVRYKIKKLMGTRNEEFIGFYFFVGSW